MMYYSIICHDTPRSFNKRQALRGAHVERLNKLKQQDRLLVAGPYFEHDDDNYITGNVIGSIIIAKFANLSEAKEWAAADPFVTAEIYCNISVNAFKPMD